MKRSEMIKIIAEQLFYRDLAAQGQYWYDPDDRPLLEEDVNKEFYYGDSNIFLNKIEKVGMLPPPNPNKYDTVPTVTPTGNHDYSFKREWEPEDES